MSLSQSEITGRIGGLAVSRYRSLRWMLFKGSYPDRVLMMVWEFYAEIQNGGLCQYFSNSTGRDTLIIGDALRVIGADYFIPSIEEAISLVGPNVFWQDDVERQRIVWNLPKDTRNRINDLGQQHYSRLEELLELLYYYLLNHRRQVHAPKTFWEGATIQ